MLDLIYLYGFKFFAFFVKITPTVMMNFILDALAWLAYAVDKRHRKIAHVNLDLAYANKMTPEEKTHIIKQCYKNLLYNMRDFIQNQNITKEALLHKVTLHNEKFYLEAKGHNKGIILLTAHYGNWELLPLYIGALYGDLLGVGRNLDTPRLNTILQQNREQFNVSMVEKSGALRRMLKALQKKHNIGLLVDQNTSDNEGILINFFGKRARHTPSAALMSRKTGAPILPAFITTTDHQHYDITFYEPFFTPRTDKIEEDIEKSVQAQASITQYAIEKKPDEWFWLHRRWKNQYEELYQ